MTTINDLISPRSAEAIKTDLLAALREREFPVTAWAEGDVARTLVEIDAEALSNAEQLIAKIATGGLGAKAAREWLTLRARNFYALDRLEARFAEGLCVLTAAPSAGPYTIEPGQLWAQTASGLRFTNTTGGTLETGGSLTLLFRAESPGTQYNVPNHTINQLVTPLPGVTINNPARPAIPGAPNPPWLVIPGTDEESDASLYARMQDRWSTIGASGATAATYRTWCHEADPQVRRVLVTASPANDGTVEVLVAGDDGALPSGVVERVQTYLDERVPLCIEAQVETAKNRIIEVTGTIYVRGDTSQSTGRAAVETYIRERVEIGDTVYRSKIIAAMASGSNVENVVLDSPAEDIQLDPDEVAVPDVSGIAVVQV